MRTISELKELQTVLNTPTWKGVAKELVRKGLNPEKILIAEVFPEDSCQEYWAVVSHDKGIYEFYYDWLESKDRESGKIIEWKDVTHNPGEAYMRDSIYDVLAHFDELIV